MIEFKGELSKTCKKFVLKNEVRRSRIALTISCFPFIVADIIWWAVSGKLYVLIALPALVFPVFLAGISQGKKIMGQL